MGKRKTKPEKLQPTASIKSQSIETEPEMIMGLADKDIKRAILNVFHMLKKVEENKNMFILIFVSYKVQLI